MSGMDKIPTQFEYANDLEGDINLNKNMIRLGKLKELAYEDVILSINIRFSLGKVEFGFGKSVKSSDFLLGNCKIAWDGLISMYAPHMVTFLFKLKSEFHNSKLKSMQKEPDEWISNLEGLRIHMGEFGQKGGINDNDFAIYILNNFTKGYNVILDEIKNSLTATGDDELTIEIIPEKLNH